MQKKVTNNTYVTIYSNKFTLKKYYYSASADLRGNYAIKALGKEARAVLGFELRH